MPRAPRMLRRAGLGGPILVLGVFPDLWGLFGKPFRALGAALGRRGGASDSRVPSLLRDWFKGVTVLPVGWDGVRDPHGR